MLEAIVDVVMIKSRDWGYSLISKSCSRNARRNSRCCIEIL